MDLAAELPRLLPRVIAWVEEQEALALASGRPLTPIERQLAVAVGVRQPERVRIRLDPELPLPDDPELRAAADATGLLGRGMIGVTFGHAVFIRAGHLTNRLASHELRHVHQYEQAGSIAAFLPRYLREIVAVGYASSPLELDARRHERDAP